MSLSLCETSHSIRFHIILLRFHHTSNFNSLYFFFCGVWVVYSSSHLGSAICLTYLSVEMFLLLVVPLAFICHSAIHFVMLALFFFGFSRCFLKKRAPLIKWVEVLDFFLVRFSINCSNWTTDVQKTLVKSERHQKQNRCPESPKHTKDPHFGFLGVFNFGFFGTMRPFSIFFICTKVAFLQFLKNHF